MTTTSITAWELIGHDGPEFVRVKGGRALYDSVMFNDDTPGGRVLLARLEVRSGGLHQVNRWVGPDTELELIPEGDIA